ncbi:MAG: NAD(P)H-dependent oxidoreductase [Cytophagales bacterium]|nr:NAD(P)H-dependent oxidoreductase [Armatimonadota bacterium]
MIKILGISGSLRAGSSNTALLLAAGKLAPPAMEFTLYEGLGDLPHFSPELDGDDPPAAVRRLRALLQAADSVIVCTPEYAHGMPGALKNALDWSVSSGEFDGKPAAAVSASPSVTGGANAHAWLTQTLNVLGATIPEGASLIVPLVRGKLDPSGAISDTDTADAFRRMFEALARTEGTRRLA